MNGEFTILLGGIAFGIIGLTGLHLDECFSGIFSIIVSLGFFALFGYILYLRRQL